MKNIFTFLFIIGISFSGFAQSLSLMHNQDSLTHGEEVHVYGDTTTNVVYAYVDVVNNTDFDIDVHVRKYEQTLVGGSENYFCWGQCYPPSAYVSSAAITVDSQSVSYEFEGEYMPHENLGTSKIMYVFFDESDPDDSVAVVVNYVVTPVNMEEAGFEPLFSAAYPNPSDDQVAFKYELPATVRDAKVVIRNMIGAVVKEAPLSGKSGEVTIETGDLNEGMYFYSYILEGKTHSTKKLVIQR
ncbi:MAG: T9SS type A sorting domain-containing protein [Bacteroidales bacterium]